MRLTHLRIPRDRMLSKFQNVTKDGKFVKSATKVFFFFFLEPVVYGIEKEKEREGRKTGADGGPFAGGRPGT